MARGLILDPDSKRVVAIPFTKSFNVGERADSSPDLPLETFEKLDGNLIFNFHHKGEWRCATKGSLGSKQAKWAAACRSTGSSRNISSRASRPLTWCRYKAVTA